MAMKPVHNPNVPCNLDLNGMFVGKTICVYGKIHKNAERFAVNLLCKNGEDIALHVNPRFAERQVVRNTRKDGWGKEEREEGNFPFKQGHVFGISIECKENEFEIRCNRYRTFATYAHRLPYSSITQVQVEHDCDVTLVCSEIEGLDIPAQVISDMGTPLKIEIPFHNIRKHSLVVVGKPTEENGRFHINFGEGDSIHFHFNPRLDKKEVVCNTLENGQWHREAKLGDTFPFQKDVPFQVRITVNKKHFDVKINGWHVLDYRKKIRQLKQIRAISVHGDVDLKEVVLY